MRKIFFTSLLLLTVAAKAQPGLYEIVKSDDGLYHLYYDSSTAKTTIVEFKNFVALLEVPIVNEGAGATNLKDHAFAGRRVLESVNHYFPKKPVKYLLHSHWHPHSLSSIEPFLKSGVTLITTEANLKKVRTFADTTVIDQFRDRIQIVKTDSILIHDRTNTIVAYRFLQTEYPSTPTAEYLYFYLPRYQALHTGCMYNRWTGPPIEGRELLTGRELDIQKFLVSNKLQPQYFLRGSGDQPEKRGMIPYERFDDVIRHGITANEINRKYLDLSDRALSTQKDSIITVLRNSHIPASMINTNVYNALRRHQLARALAFAHILTSLAPDDANSWDTLGEVYYFMNEIETAKGYASLCRMLSPDFNGGGVDVWKRDLEQFRKQWQ